MISIFVGLNALIDGTAGSNTVPTLIRDLRVVSNKSGFKSAVSTINAFISACKRGNLDSDLCKDLRDSLRKCVLDMKSRLYLLKCNKPCLNDRHVYAMMRNVSKKLYHSRSVLYVLLTEFGNKPVIKIGYTSDLESCIKILESKFNREFLVIAAKHVSSNMDLVCLESELNIECSDYQYTTVNGKTIPQFYHCNGYVLDRFNKYVPM